MVDIYRSTISPSTLIYPIQSQSHGKIVRKLSKKLKVSGRKVTPPNDFMAVRPSSPVLFSMHPSVISSPLHLPSLVEESGSFSSPHNASIGRLYNLLDGSCDHHVITLVSSCDQLDNKVHMQTLRGTKHA